MSYFGQYIQLSEHKNAVWQVQSNACTAPNRTLNCHGEAIAVKHPTLYMAEDFVQLIRTIPVSDGHASTKKLDNLEGSCVEEMPRCSPFDWKKFVETFSPIFHDPFSPLVSASHNFILCTVRSFL